MANTVVAETRLTEPGSNPAGTGPPLGGAGRATVVDGPGGEVVPDPDDVVGPVAARLVVGATAWGGDPQDAHTTAHPSPTTATSLRHAGSVAHRVLPARGVARGSHGTRAWSRPSRVGQSPSAALRAAPTVASTVHSSGAKWCSEVHEMVRGSLPA